ncbi:hypothetical protein GCM10023194_81270 [Planotetraspora phitsanulokensis]|uniref:Uncharacterized protein n=1 Tax=Planotetraspora phitsanulokensis TaxID=575192 RepID=A0A8J3XJ73_9ACTN|nr:hypothetical protein [Planotetraspora phitsanulokensis]GII42890.1 hypothetical protein Pph01_78930 [Planotetraspora phitsanulokensis]
MNATIEITDQVAQDLADRIAEHFGGHPDYPPQVMDEDWDGDGGRVILWPHHLLDWAFLVRHGGMSGYGYSTVYKPVPLPEGVWVEPVNPQAIRVLALPR